MQNYAEEYGAENVRHHELSADAEAKETKVRGMPEVPAIRTELNLSRAYP
jgi:hypothetical protein